MGRLRWARPEPGHGAWLERIYTLAMSTSLAEVQAIERPNQSTTGVLSEQSYAYDGAGRLVEESRRLADGTWSQRTTTYSSMGWRTAVSEWHSPTAKTVHQTWFSGHNPFARPGLIVPPDGIGHKVELSYEGVRRTERRTSIGTSMSEAESIIETPNVGGDPITSTYGYDVDGNLSSVSIQSGSQTQSRAFIYGRRGFLLSEQHPELSSAGVGSDLRLGKLHGRAIETGSRPMVSTTWLEWVS